MALLMSKFFTSSDSDTELTPTSPEKTILEDVAYLKGFSSLVENMSIFGLVLDTHTGILKQVV